MFEQPAGKEEKDRSRSIMILSALAVIVVIVLIVLVTSFGKRQAPAPLARAGSPDFDNYAPFVTFSNIELHTGERLNTRFGRILCTVKNDGNRVLEGLQIRAYAVGFNREVFQQKIVTVVPNNAEQLAPGETLRLDLYLEPIPDPTTIQDMKVEMWGLALR